MGRKQPEQHPSTAGQIASSANQHEAAIGGRDSRDDGESDAHVDVEIGPAEWTPEQTLRSEVNFLVLPFFALSRHDVYQRTKTEYQATIKRGAERLSVSWKVSANPEYGYPGPFDRQVHKAVEQIVNELAPPLQNPIPLGSLYHIAKLLGLEQSGQVYRDIKQAIQRIVATTIESKGTFYSKDQQEWIEDQFHLYERVVFKGRRLPSGRVADTNYLFLSSWLIDNINARYVRPLDFAYYRSLHGYIASRLYELLGVKFYGSRFPFIRYRYSALCQLLPVARQQYLSRAKEKLRPAHRELVRTGFLSEVEWANVPGEKHDWYVSYWPGPKAEREMRQSRGRLPLEAAMTGTSEMEADDASRGEASPEDGPAEPVASTQPAQQQHGRPRASQASRRKPSGQRSEVTGAQQALLNELEELGVSRATAGRLVLGSDPQHVQDWIRVVREDGSIRDRSAYLVKALREHWQLPEWFDRKERGQAEERGRRERCPVCRGEGFYAIDEDVVAVCRHTGQKKAPREDATGATADIWNRVLGRLREQVIGPIYEGWLKETRLLGLDGDTALVVVANWWTAEYLNQRLYGVVVRELENVLDRLMEVEFVVGRGGWLQREG